jgi:hypothetical protein
MAPYALASLAETFDAQIVELVRIATLVDVSVAEPRSTAEFCIIQLQDCWTRFVRDLILRSTLGNASRASGARIPPGPLGSMYQRAAMRHLRANWPGSRKKPPYWDPKWFDQGEAGKAIGVLQPMNAVDLTAAIGANTNPIQEVRSLRNFVAHRGESSMNVVQVHFPGRHRAWSQPHQLVLHRPGVGGPSLFEDWCRRFRLVAAAAIQ